MKGMLVKDVRFLMRQKSSMIIFLGLGLFFMLSSGELDMALAYIMMMVSIFATSSISYDEFDNGMPFLMTLPVQRKTYVFSKYLFALILALTMGCCMSGMALLLNVLGLMEIDLSGVPEGLGAAAAAAMIMASIMIPVYLKFGAEKFRYAMAIVVGLVFAVAFVIQRVAGRLIEKIAGTLEQLSKLPAAQIAGLVLGCVVAVVAISIFLSVKIMERKEY